MTPHDSTRCACEVPVRTMFVNGTLVCAKCATASPIPSAGVGAVDGFTRDDGGLTDRFVVIRQSNGQVVFDTDDLAEAQQAKQDCEETDPQNAYCLADTQSPALTAALAAAEQGGG